MDNWPRDTCVCRDFPHVPEWLQASGENPSTYKHGFTVANSSRFCMGQTSIQKIGDDVYIETHLRELPLILALPSLTPERNPFKLLGKQGKRDTRYHSLGLYQST